MRNPGRKLRPVSQSISLVVNREVSVRSDNPESLHSVQVATMSPASRRDEVFRLFAATRSVLVNNRKRRQLVTAELRRELRSHRETIRTVLMMIRRGWTASADDKTLHSTAREQEATGGVSESLQHLNERHSLPELLDGGLPQETRLLHAIQRHPEGVSIVDIGNELGVDFRRLLSSTDALLAAGQIDQVQELFYPAGR